MDSIPTEFHDLFEKRTIAHFATLLPNGTPHSTPIWIDYDEHENRVLVNTEKGRQKHINVKNNPAVCVSMVDPDDSHRWLSVIGTVVSETEENAANHADKLEKRYTGEDEYHGNRSLRIVLKIKPDKVLRR